MIEVPLYPCVVRATTRGRFSFEAHHLQFNTADIRSDTQLYTISPNSRTLPMDVGPSLGPRCKIAPSSTVAGNGISI